MDFESLLLHPANRATLAALRGKPPHGLLLTGPTGFGKRHIAITWATIPGQDVDIRVVEPDEKQTITIDAVRNLYRESRGKHAGRQVIIVHNAQAMGTEAQNAFLKLLEEPPTGVVFILTASDAEALLPTIRSRAQHVALQNPPAGGLQQLAQTSQPAMSSQDVAQLLFIANGRPATLARLLANPDHIEAARERMLRAKNLLGTQPYERYVTIAKLTDRQECLATLEAMAQMVQMQLLRSPAASQQQWVTRAEQLQTVLQNIKQNGNIKAQLLSLFTA